MGKLLVLALTAFILAPSIAAILYASIPSNHVVGWRKVSWMVSGVASAALFMVVIFPAASW